MSNSKLSSKIWNFFTINAIDESKANCDMCNERLTRGGSNARSYGTSALINHLRSFHHDEYELYRKWSETSKRQRDEEDEEKEKRKQKQARLLDRNVLKDATRSAPQRPTQSRKSNPKSTAVKRIPENSNLDLPQEQRLSVSSATVASIDGASEGGQSRVISNEKKKTMAPAEAGTPRQDLTGTGVVASPKDNVHCDTARPQENSEGKESGEAGYILDEQFILKHEIADLEKFREHQKMIEEQNKKKKQMLTAAINERQKKAKAEATKLTVIKRELDRLDQMVSVDVSVIRNKIEEISREFLDAQKRYNYAEREFIEAKVDLHKKSQQKEQLTEHLYTVIHQNEQRKAKKLAELMNKLEMEESEDGTQDDYVHSPPVPICHISPAEPRKGCLQSLGLTLITSAPTVTPDDSGAGIDASADASSELKNSENAAATATDSTESRATPAVGAADGVAENQGLLVESAVTNIKTEVSETSQISEVSAKAEAEVASH